MPSKPTKPFAYDRYNHYTLQPIPPFAPSPGEMRAYLYYQRYIEKQSRDTLAMQLWEMKDNVE